MDCCLRYSICTWKGHIRAPYRHLKCGMLEIGEIMDSTKKEGMKRYNQWIPKDVNRRLTNRAGLKDIFFI